MNIFTYLILSSTVYVCVVFDKLTYIVIEEIGYFYVCLEIECPQHLEREVLVNITTVSSTASKNR